MAATGPPRRGETDDPAALLVARLRAVVLTFAALGAALAFGEDGHRGLQYALAWFAVPAAVALALAADRLAVPLAAALGAAIDVAVLAATVLAFPDAAGAIGAAFLVPVLLSSYTGGRVLGAAVGAAGIATIGVADVWGRVGPSTETLLLLTIAVVVSLAVVGRADALLLRSTSRAQFHEARASLIVEHLAESIVVTDRNAKVTQYNAAAASLLSIPPGAATCEAVLGLRIEGRPLDCSAGCGLQAVEASRDSGGVEASACADGAHPVPVMVSVAEIPDASGETVEFLHTLRDITKLKLADEAKTLFLATATHELKTPVTVIAGFLHAIAEPGVADELRSTAIEIMQRRADELSGIIQRVLLASQIESGGLELDLVPVDAVAVARERTTALASATARTITLSVEDDLPSLLGDEAALSTVLDHLLDNANKYSPRESEVAVSIDVDDSAVVLAVSDSGDGMTSEQAEHCFDRFWQADATSRRKVGGTGIGLYIVRSLVESMRGSVSVASTPGEGSAFTVRLRRYDVPEPASPGTGADRLVPEPSIVREFMRQIGVDTQEIAP
ncbi:MAG: ATP-binding protein [Acidimicrobiales bacterium]